MKDFQLCIRDMVERTGAVEQDVTQMLGTNKQPNIEVFQEFAKCFIPQVIDPINNYELYEMSGDMALNKAAFTYLFRILQPVLSDKESSKYIGYVANLKSYYVSKTFYSTLSIDLGFDEFLKRVCYQNQAAMAVYFSDPSKKIQSLYEDIMEAFIGCLEIQMDRYIGMHRGYVYVANFVFELLSNKKIDFRPETYWGPITLLKESNDRIKSHNAKQRVGLPLLPIFRITKIQQQPNGYKVQSSIDMRQVRDEFRTWDDYPRVQPIMAESKEDGEKKLTETLLAVLKQNPDYGGLLKLPPTAEQIGVESLIKD
jgi:hypothetical protein